MKDVEIIKERIKNRKHKVLTDHTFNRFYSFMIKSMIMLALVIGIGSYIKMSPNAKYIHNVLSQMVSLKDVGNLFVYTNNNESVEVSKEVSYTHIEGNYYTNNSNEGVSLMDGIVVESGEAPILGNYITVMNDNIKITYGCLDNVFVNQYDEVDESMIVGTYNDKIMLIFNEGEKEIDYSTFEELVE